MIFTSKSIDDVIDERFFRDIGTAHDEGVSERLLLHGIVGHRDSHSFVQVAELVLHISIVLFAF